MFNKLTDVALAKPAILPDEMLDQVSGGSSLATPAGTTVTVPIQTLNAFQTATGEAPNLPVSVN